MTNAIGVVWVLIAITTWGVSSIGYKKGMGNKASADRDPVTSLAFRYIIVTLALTPFVFLLWDFSGLFELPEKERNTYIIFALLSGLFDIVGHGTYFFALRHLDSSRVYPLINFQMIFTFPIAIYIFGEAIPRFLWLSVILIVLGVTIIGKPDNKDAGFEGLSEIEKKKHHKTGVIFGLLTGLFFALFYLSMAQQNKIWYGEWESNYARLALSSIMIWVYVLLRPKHLPKKNHLEYKDQMRSYIMIGFFAILSAGIGDAVYQMGVTENGSAISITLASLAPLINQFLAILFLKEKFRPRFLVGVIFIILGNILILL